MKADLSGGRAAEQPWVRRRREREAEAGPCDLDGAEFILATAWVHPSSRRWVASKHGCGTLEAMRACGCPTCVQRIEVIERRPAPLPLSELDSGVRVDAVAVRRRVGDLLALGWSRRAIAERAGIDATTVDRVMRPDVARVRAETARALLSLDLPAGQAATASSHAMTAALALLRPAIH